MPLLLGGQCYLARIASEGLIRLGLRGVGQGRWRHPWGAASAAVRGAPAGAAPRCSSAGRQLQQRAQRPAHLPAGEVHADSGALVASGSRTTLCCPWLACASSAPRARRRSGCAWTACSSGAPAQEAPAQEAPGLCSLGETKTSPPLSLSPAVSALSDTRCHWGRAGRSTCHRPPFLLVWWPHHSLVPHAFQKHPRRTAAEVAAGCERLGGQGEVSPCP